MRQIYWAYPGHDTGLPAVFEQAFDGIKILDSNNMNDITEKDVVLFDGGTDIDSDIYNERKHPLAQKPDYMRDQMERVYFRRAQGVGAACIGVPGGTTALCSVWW
jgi:gamma-glutamyl-gamma-aminobutyrate hydrolase PuuD